jgi:hypothetical protein
MVHFWPETLLLDATGAGICSVVERAQLVKL